MSQAWAGAAQPDSVPNTGFQVLKVSDFALAPVSSCGCRYLWEWETALGYLPRDVFVPICVRPNSVKLQVGFCNPASAGAAEGEGQGCNGRSELAAVVAKCCSLQNPSCCTHC